MKNNWLIVVLLAVFIGGCEKATTFLPAPTSGTELASFGEEDGDNQLHREAWIAQMHQAAPGTSWKDIEFRNAKQRFANNSGSRDCNANIEIDSSMTGSWHERGSLNQAGSVVATDYDPETNMVYTISAGGTLWKGVLSGNEWEVVNQDFRFSQRALKLVKTATGLRIISAINGKAFYSDDGGLTWIAASGIQIDNANQAVFQNIITTNEQGATLLYALGKPDYWSEYRFYRSNDLGENWTNEATFGTNNSNQLSLIKSNNSEDIYLLENTGGTKGKLYQWDADNTLFLDYDINSDVPLLKDRAFLIGSWKDNYHEFYLLNEDQYLVKTTDLFQTFEVTNGRIDNRPWDVGLFQSPSNSDLILSGAVELSKTVNGGQNFFQQNTWGEYYANVFGKLHADIMYIDEYQKSDGTSFILISNHGGLSVSYDGMASTENIGLVNLNVSQYYSVRTDPTDPKVVYAGAQDQGFQRSTFGTEDQPEYFDQVISGDYGHIVFSNNGNSMWTVYPGGWVTYYDSPQFGGHTASIDLDFNFDEALWLPPLAEVKGSADNSIFIAGGNVDTIVQSHLIKLTHSNGVITTEQNDFDFLSNAGGKLTCIAISNINTDHVYAGTANGRFFVSIDGGENFEQSVDFLPNGNYLYGASIYASKANPETIYFGGSGYSNPAIWVSDNNGFSFINMSAGLPNTLVYGITGTANDEYLFAATEARPYIYVSAEEIWKPLAGDCVPNQTYWSVEYVESINTVRFGTYGRGIWEFVMEPIIMSSLDDIHNDFGLTIFPNPSQDFIQLKATTFSNWNSADIMDSQGRIVKVINDLDLANPINIRELAAGNYFLKVSSANGTSTLPFVKID